MAEVPPPPDCRPADLDRLRAQYPRWDISQTISPHNPPRWEAVACDLATTPYCLITTDLAELERELAAAGAGEDARSAPEAPAAGQIGGGPSGEGGHQPP